ncbi:uncharacterized protein LOC129740230 [Uranotaenia lowii]|uniref:uncharacterized protein LOC129740230 n=1 Tax=Uranotaenia lowii TaxID=190385 RepID=UPI00247A17F1|nr:uncharacterized protein LOC129740230 [Uranotaenia lowii]
MKPLVLLSLAVKLLVAREFYEEPVDYDPCPCPCAKLDNVEVQLDFETNANCVILDSKYGRGMLYGDQYRNGLGQRWVYYDTNSASHKHRNYPVGSAWKIYYPWQNVSSDADVPLVIENIQYKMFMMPTTVNHYTCNHVTLDPLMSDQVLWWIFRDSDSFKIRNQATGQWMHIHPDANYKGGADKGWLCTESDQRSDSSRFPGLFSFYADNCWPLDYDRADVTQRGSFGVFP